MKRIFTLILSLCLVFVSVGCENKEQAPSASPSDSENQVLDSAEQPENKAVDYDTTVAWVNYAEDASKLYTSALNNDKMLISSVRHLPIFKCESVEELDRFQSDYSDVLSFSAQYDEFEAFNEISKKFDSAFFEEKSLLLVYLTAGSGSYRYGVDNLYINTDNVMVHLKQTNEGGVGTCDMAGWLICISLPKESIKACTSFDAVLI